MGEIERSEFDRAAENLRQAIENQFKSMKITRNQLQRFAQLAHICGYNSELKAEYQRLGKKILKKIVDCLGLKRGEYRLSWNPGGIAVSGDHTLHTDKFYLALSDNCNMGSFYYRTCSSMRDYCGNQNIHISRDTFPDKFSNLIESLRRLQVDDSN